MYLFCFVVVVVALFFVRVSVLRNENNLGKRFQDLKSQLFLFIYPKKEKKQ